MLSALHAFRLPAPPILSHTYTLTSPTFSKMANAESASGSPRTVFYVTKDSQKNLQERSKKHSYAGLRDLREVGSIQEEDIVGKSGELLGIKNRVRAGLAHFENPDAILRVRPLLNKSDN